MARIDDFLWLVFAVSQTIGYWDFGLRSISCAPGGEQSCLLDDTLTHEELRTVDEDPRYMTNYEHHHDANEDDREVHLVVDAGIVVPVRSSVSIS